MAKVSAELLKRLQELPRDTITVPILGAVVVRGMTGMQRDAFEKSLIEGRGKKREVNVMNLRAKLVAKTVYDADDRDLLFTEADVIALGDGRADVLSKLYTIAAKLSGISEEDEDELGKPLGTETPGPSSSSPSPVNLV